MDNMETVKQLRLRAYLCCTLTCTPVANQCCYATLGSAGTCMTCMGCNQFAMGHHTFHIRNQASNGSCYQQ